MYVTSMDTDHRNIRRARSSSLVLRMGVDAHEETILRDVSQKEFTANSIDFHRTMLRTLQKVEIQILNYLDCFYFLQSPYLLTNNYFPP